MKNAYHATQQALTNVFILAWPMQGRVGDARDEPEGGNSVPTEKHSEIISAEHLSVKPKSSQSLYLHTPTPPTYLA